MKIGKRVLGRAIVLGVLCSISFAANGMSLQDCKDGANTAHNDRLRDVCYPKTNEDERAACITGSYNTMGTLLAWCDANCD